MNKKGFTFIELLGVIAILSVVITISTVSIMGISNSIREKMVQTKIDSFQVSAIEWGQKNMDSLDETCNVSGVDYKFCKLVTVGFLVAENEIEAEERDKDGNQTVINNATNESMMDDKIQIYKKNNRVYALYLGK